MNDVHQWGEGVMGEGEKTDGSKLHYSRTRNGRGSTRRCRGAWASGVGWLACRDAWRGARGLGRLPGGCALGLARAGRARLFLERGGRAAFQARGRDRPESVAQGARSGGAGPSRGVGLAAGTRLPRGTVGRERDARGERKLGEREKREGRESPWRR
jgi:hypothetical protein